MHSLLIHFITDEKFGLFLLLTIKNNATVNIIVRIYMCAFLLHAYLGMKLLSHRMDTSHLLILLLIDDCVVLL